MSESNLQLGNVYGEKLIRSAIPAGDGVEAKPELYAFGVLIRDGNSGIWIEAETMALQNRVHQLLQNHEETDVLVRVRGEKRAVEHAEKSAISHIHPMARMNGNRIG